MSLFAKASYLNECISSVVFIMYTLFFSGLYRDLLSKPTFKFLIDARKISICAVTVAAAIL